MELVFNWIKQHLRIKAFFGTIETAAKTQARIAISVYVLLAIMKKASNPNQGLYPILQIPSENLFEKEPVYQAFSSIRYAPQKGGLGNPSNLLD